MPQCPTCGSAVTDNADVCPDCGMDLQTAAPASMQPPPPAAPPVVPPAPVAPQSPPSGAAAWDDADIFGTPTGVERTVVIDPAPPIAPVAPVGVSPSPVSPSPVSPSPVAPPVASPSATLTLKRGGAVTTDRFLLGAFAVIGRFDPESGPVDVDMGPLPEAVYVSRHHAEIRCDENKQWFIKDMGSRNGTFVRSGGQGSFQRVAGEQVLQHGDEISLGNARFEFHVASSNA